MNIIPSLLIIGLLIPGASPSPSLMLERIWSFNWRAAARAACVREVKAFSLRSRPVDGGRIRRPEGEFGAVRRGGWSYHKGVDFLAAEGTPVRAPLDGFICYNELNGALDQGYGYTLIIDHGNNFYTLYAHLRERSPRRVGEQVAAGETVGSVGHSGNATRLPKRFKNQLHFEIIHAPSGLMDIGGLKITGLLSRQRITTLRRIGEAIYGVYRGGVLNPEEFGEFR